MTLTLEKELRTRIFIHRVAVLSAYIKTSYMKAKTLEQGVQLTPNFIEDEAEAYANKMVQQAMCNGSLECLYEQAWEKVKDKLPEHVKVL